MQANARMQDKGIQVDTITKEVNERKAIICKQRNDLIVRERDFRQVQSSNMYMSRQIADLKQKSPTVGKR